MKHIKLLEFEYKAHNIWWIAKVESSNPLVMVSVAWYDNVFAGNSDREDYKKFVIRYLTDEKKYDRYKYKDTSETSNSVDISFKNFEDFLKFKKDSDVILNKLKERFYK